MLSQLFSWLFKFCDMIFLISLSIALIISFGFANIIRSHSLQIYLLTVLSSALTVFSVWNRVAFTDWFDTWVSPLFSRGALAGALFAVIMCIGALPNGSKASKRLMPIRGQLSIIACILTFGHNIAYGKTYFTALFITPSRMAVTTLIASVCSLVMIIIMVPLFITSFTPIRRKMKAKNWKQLQRFAYLFYALVYCHIMLLMIPNAISGRSGYLLSVFVYSLVFLSYLICRVLKAVAVKEKTTKTLPMKQLGGIICGGVMASLILLSVLSAKKTAAANEELEELRIAIELSTMSAQISENPMPSESEEPQATMAVTESVPADQEAESTVPSAKYKNGIYTGSGEGNHGTRRDVEVNVTIENDKIISIEITGFRDDEEYFSPSIEGTAMIAEMLEKQSPYVDVITGATESSAALIHAVSDALNQAKNAGSR